MAKADTKSAARSAKLVLKSTILASGRLFSLQPANLLFVSCIFHVQHRKVAYPTLKLVTSFGVAPGGCGGAAVPLIQIGTMTRW